MVVNVSIGLLGLEKNIPLWDQLVKSLLLLLLFLCMNAIEDKMRQSRLKWFGHVQ